MCVKYSAEWWQRVASVTCEHVQDDPKQGQAAVTNEVSSRGGEKVMVAALEMSPPSALEGESAV